MKDVLKRRIGTVLVAFGVLGVLSCGGKGNSPTSPSSSSTPQITACNTVVHQGTTYSNMGCTPGVASFTSTITQAGRTSCFNVTCSAGCVSAVRTC